MGSAESSSSETFTRLFGRGILLTSTFAFSPIDLLSYSSVDHAVLFTFGAKHASPTLYQTNGVQAKLMSFYLVFQGNVKRAMAVHASAATSHGNYVASSQPGCHIAHYTADWIIETSAFEAEDYGLESGEEEGMPDIVVDPETRSLRYDRMFMSTLHALAVASLRRCGDGAEL